LVRKTASQKSNQGPTAADGSERISWRNRQALGRKTLEEVAQIDKSKLGQSKPDALDQPVAAARVTKVEHAAPSAW